MKCEDCGFEYETGTVCPQCGYDAAVELLDCVQKADAPLANPLEQEFNALAKRVEAEEINKDKIQERWQEMDKLAAEGNLDARHLFAHLALVKDDLPNAVKILTGLANAGYALAHLDLARLYEEGKGVEQNLFNAIKHYRLAAAAGNPIALFMLAQQHGGNGALRTDPALANAIMEQLVTRYPDMFQRKSACNKGGCNCGNTQTAGEFAAQTASEMSCMFKYLVVAGLLIFLIYVVWTEFLAH